MKDLVSCFSEHAVRISDVACSGSANAATVSAAGVAAAGVGDGGGAGRAAVSAVTSVYRSRLSASGKDLVIDVTWSRAPDGPALSVAVHDAAAASRLRGGGGGAAGAAPRHLHRRKGSGTFTAGSCVVGVFWDFAAARYAAGPEPVSGYYVAVVADAEFVLLLGDMSRGYVERLHGGIPIAGSRMARRRERFVGCGCWSTRARFLESGAEHDIVVALDGDAEGLGDRRRPEGGAAPAAAVELPRQPHPLPRRRRAGGHDVGPPRLALPRGRPLAGLLLRRRLHVPDARRVGDESRQLPLADEWKCRILVDKLFKCNRKRIPSQDKAVTHLCDIQIITECTETN
ncbi:hypothetical protein OsJ_14700 [Oryza sativa Japonica Group]|uniref:Uncharacterized protein n=1 Tax=Oryza sativa subsp. japonica TaxID=39947 RepID=B9FF14_ORYSJ|nr:hypothetical protein OsJ_14700 [Oryza sativa Japonica Group]